jgi:predicted SAM-dependent methyltransferase
MPTARAIAEVPPDFIRRHAASVRLSLVQRRDARRLKTLDGALPKLHLGCGAHTKPGWVNIDMWHVPSEMPRRGGTTTINFDLTADLPLSDNRCAEIYSSHFLEHLTAEDGVRLLTDAHRVLRPGGRLRTCLPDFARVARAYVDADNEYFAPLYEVFPDRLGDGVPGSATILDAVNNVLYQWGEHKCMYDTAKLVALLSAIGFSRVEPSSFDPSIDGAWDAREHFSIYVDAFK